MNPGLISITNLTCRIARGPFSDVFAISAASATGVVNHEAFWSPIVFVVVNTNSKSYSALSL